MKKSIALSCLILTIFALSSCGKADTLKSFSKQSGVDISWGDIVSEQDTHDGFHGFHGDGVSITVVHFSDGSAGEEMKENEHWHSLPLSESLNTFIYQPWDDAISIPEITNGYYYFYDRHSESADPYDDTDLLNRSSLNFTAAIYDSDTDTLYLCEEDT